MQYAQDGDLVLDHYTGSKIEYPAKVASLKYDFHFRRCDGDAWRYMNSFNKSSRTLKGQITAVVEGGGEWRIVEAKTGQVVDLANT